MFKAIIIIGGAAGLLFIIKKLNTMGENLDQIKQALADASVKADKIQADVTKLTGMIGNVGDEAPTQEQWDEVKALAADLNNKLQGIDDQTADDTTTEG